MLHSFSLDKVVGIKEAIRLGVLDSDLSSFKDLLTGTHYTIQEAIDRGLLLATLDGPNQPVKDSTTGESWCCNVAQVIFSLYSTTTFLPPQQNYMHSLLEPLLITDFFKYETTLVVTCNKLCHGYVCVPYDIA